MPEALFAGSQQPTRLGALELDLAPDAPGIYAWYAKIALSSSDWRPRLQGDRDLARDDLRSAVIDYARLHVPAPLHLSGAAPYGLKWTGLLRKQSVAEEDQEGRTRIETQLEGFDEMPENRQLLTELLRTAPPIFASPLYIGVATNLRLRLAEHKASFETAKLVLKNAPKRAEEYQFRGKDLGTRLAGSGIPLERLECWIIAAPQLAAKPTEASTLASSTERRGAAHVAEWVLQRIFQPILGRQ